MAGSVGGDGGVDETKNLFGDNTREMLKDNDIALLDFMQAVKLISCKTTWSRFLETGWIQIGTILELLSFGLRTILILTRKALI